ncbi:MAG: hypothetical protein E7107_06455 [Prevotella sp.]|jgi:hypothetical protein|nr:hypothetical protein [Prevotella sp.]
MKKNIILLFVTVCAIVACDPTHEDISNAGNITIDELKAKSSITVDKAGSGANGNVITCQTLAAVNAKWDIGGKEFIGNFATKKMKLGKHKVILTALCADGTILKDSVEVECQEITDPLQKFWIYGDVANFPEQVPFSPGAWDAAAMRFSSTEGAHLPTIPDDVYFGLKTLIFDISDANGVDMKVMNGWWSNTYYDHVNWVDGLNELQITETMAKECAKGNGGEGRDLDLMLYSGSMTLNSVYYEE